MNTKLLLSLFLLCSILVPAQTRRKSPAPRPSVPPSAPSPAASQLPIRRVILYSNGVAYIERRGIVTGDTEINLSFKPSQVDDVLKSMVVLDLGQGKIGAVSYNSSAPTESRLAEIPFSVSPQTSDGAGLAGVLSQLQGARVAVTSASGAANGSILTVERKSATNDKGVATTTNILVIASETGEISSFDLAQVKGVRLLDEGARKDLNEFSNAAASARRRDAKTISITSSGAGSREMIVSYTIAAPIWKTTYRVVLDDAGKPFFQGWAIVDNISDEDWSNVQLSLISGSPISFIQQLQKPFYRYRPVVPMPRDLQLAPQVYEPQSGLTQNRPGNNTADATLNTGITSQQLSQLPARRNQQVQTQQSFMVDGTSGSQNVFLIDGQEVTNFRTGALNSNNNMITDTPVGDALVSSNSGVQTNTATEEIGDLFEYRIEQPVSVSRDRSALIPIIQSKMDGERAAIYNEAVRRDRPYSGVLLKNLSNLTFEAGSLTVIDGNAYAGEALMDRLKAREQRLISFALDLGTHVRVRDRADREPSRIIKVVRGTIQVQYFQTSEKTYEIENQVDRPKVMYIEYPVRDGWTLTKDSPEPDYTTQKYYRFRVELKGMEKKELKIGVRQQMADSYQLASFSRADLQLFVNQRYIDDATRVKLEKIIDIRQKLQEIEERDDKFDEEVSSITADQKRLRENIEALSKTAEAKTLIARYIQKANDQETRLEEIEKTRKADAAENARLEQELAREIRAFSIE